MFSLGLQPSFSGRRRAMLGSQAFAKEFPQFHSQPIASLRSTLSLNGGNVLALGL